MKKITLLLCTAFVLPAMAQEHFSAISTSKRVGILNGNVNPSEFANLGSRVEIQLFGLSVNASSNKVGFSDLVNGEDVEDLMFSGSKAVDFTTNAELALPGVAFKALGWGFAVTSGAHVTANVIGVNSDLGRALVGDSDIDAQTAANIIENSGNQRINATTWGEIGFSAARKIYENDKHRFNAGLTLKLLFPGSYANFGASQFNGTISYEPGGPYLSNASANLNVAYSGSLADNFTDTSDYTSSLFGNLKGMAGDIGFDYQLKSGSGYKLKVGLAVKNMGSMTFKSDKNSSTDYQLSITGTDRLNLNDFNDSESLSDVEEVLITRGFLDKSSPEKTNFKVKLPTVLNLYADYNILPTLNVTLFLQQKMNKDEKNDQVASQNIFSITPRVNISFFEAFLPVSFNEISGTTAGFGFRLAGFYLGSNSVLTAIGDGKQADAYLGYRFGFL
ncbi:hypothetical protein [Flavobacterium sp. 3HN19-14]|uniref:hypothetical protein n=1 Tax=Flavobacterium sp. 3HN19-14 TaxID=3448133 RepID=UPI003EE0BB22